jgi:ribosomal protein L37AE/L43A
MITLIIILSILSIYSLMSGPKRQNPNQDILSKMDEEKYCPYCKIISVNPYTNTCGICNRKI